MCNNPLCHNRPNPDGSPCSLCAQPAPAPCSGCGCEHDEIHNPTDTCATCNGGSRYHMPKPAPAPGATCNDSLQVHVLPDFVESALGVVALSDFPSVESVLRHHISDLTRRLAEAEAENGRFAEMLESSVSDWRKLYAEERAERVRIQGILLNDVQAEHQESDEHIKGLDAVIKTQDKTIRDLKTRVAEAEAERDALRELEKDLGAAVEQKVHAIFNLGRCKALLNTANLKPERLRNV